MKRYYWVQYHWPEWIIRVKNKHGRWETPEGLAATAPVKIGEEIANPYAPKEIHEFYPVFFTIDGAMFGKKYELLKDALSFNRGLDVVLERSRVEGQKPIFLLHFNER